MDTIQILFIEDNPADQRLIYEMLRGRTDPFFSLIWAGRLADGLREISGKKIDVILLDLDLPDSRDLEGLDKITGQYPQIPIIVLTGADDENIGFQAIQRHAADYLIKGKIDISLLTRSIRYAIERKRAEARENEALAIAMSARTAMDTLQAMGEGVLLMDMNGHILSVNPALEQLSGLQKNKVLGRPFMDFLLPMLEEKDKPMALEAYATALSGKNPQLQPLTLINKRGWLIPVIPAVSFIRAPDGKVTAIILTVRDISEIRAMQQNLEENNTRLRALAERLSSTEERERHRISAQIHDTVIQTLSLSNIKLGALLKKLAGTGSKNSIKEVTAIRAIIEDAIRESRSLMAELTPPLLYELGLVPAITDLAQKLQKQHNTPIHVKDDEHPRQVDKAIQGILFQATRELILNALKHAGKCAITVTVSRENDRLRIYVEDNGSGFSVPEEGRFVFRSDGGFGLFAIRERLERIGGSLVIRSQAGAGTSVALFAPLALRNAEGRMEN